MPQILIYVLMSYMLVFGYIVHPNECRPSAMTNDDDYESRGPQQQKDDEVTQNDLLNNGMNIDETQAVPVLIEVPDSDTGSSSDDDQQPSPVEEASEISPAESAPPNHAHYTNQNNQYQQYQHQQRRPTDLKTAASYKHHKKHGAKGWLDMGAWTNKKGAFGWYDKHPVGKGK